MTHRAFEPATLGTLKLSNRIVVAPTTRNRTLANGPVATITEYYRRRATAGLIVTEGMSPVSGLGDSRVPGLFNHDHVSWWGYVTAAVHWRGGNIFVRLAHPAEASSGPDSSRLRDAMVRSSVLAVMAGFDGVEVDATNGYGLAESLKPIASAAGADDYARFALDVVDDVANAIGADRTGLRLSPWCVRGGPPGFAELTDKYTRLAAELQTIGAAYLHLINRSSKPGVSSNALRAIRRVFTNTLILNDGFETMADIDAAFSSGDADLVAVGRPLIENPDFVDGLKRGIPLSEDVDAAWLSPASSGVARFVDHPTAA